MALAYATCVPGDTEVFLSNGEPTKIGNLVEDELKKIETGGEAVSVANSNSSIFTWNDKHLVEHNVIAVQKLPSPKKLIKLKPASGIPVKSTPDHKVLVDTTDGSKWVEASQLKTGDWIYAPRKILNKNPVCPRILEILPDDTIVTDDWLKKECQEALLNKFGSIRRASRELNIPRNPLSQRSKQGLRLKYIKKICDATNLDLSSIYNNVKELKGNAGIRVSLTTPVVTESFMYLIGLIASDGYIHEIDRRCHRSHTIVFTNENEQLVKLFVEICQSIFPTVPVKVKKVNRTFRVITSNFVLANVANSLGIHSPKENTDLNGIFKLPENHIAAFIRGYFDGDGTCYFERASHYHIKITTHQPRIAKRLNQLLKRLNIRSNVFKRKENFDIVTSTPGDELQFVNKIGSNHPKKAKLLEEYSRNLKDRYLLDDFDLMPLICGNHIKNIRSKYGIAQHALPIYRGQLGKAEKLKSRLRRASLRKIVETLRTRVSPDDRNLEILSTICESPFYVEPLKEVKEEFLFEDDTNKFVYDITVEKAHSFIPEGVMVVSNCDVGAHHNRAWAITYDIKVGRETYTKDKVEWVIYLQHIRPLFDCLGTCRLQWVELALDPEYYARFYSAATGVSMTLADLLKSSERIYNLTRAISVKRGLTAKDDWLPERDFEDPISVGSISVAKLDRDKFRDFLGLYYELRGWNKNGVPTREKLIELELEDVSRELERLKAHV
jgi:intein/homing endonuclease